MATESIFKPELADSISPGHHEIAFESILRCENELRRDFVSNIVVTGGNTRFPNYNERFQRELSALLPGLLKAKCTATPDKSNAVWLGGAIASQIQTFQANWITRAEYDDIGIAAVLRKCM